MFKKKGGLMLLVVIVLLCCLLPTLNVKEGMSNLNNNNTVDNTPWLTFCAANNRPNPSSPANYKNQPAPQDMFFFKNTSFKPECCPATYSTSVGCACVSEDQKKLINQRGGNRLEGEF